MKPKVQRYFQKTSQNFDAIYASEKSLYQRLADLLFHGVIEQRFKAAFAELGDLRGKTLLDVGCGSGRYMLEAARRGANRVVGLDFSQNMLDLAQRHLKHEGYDKSSQLINRDFLEFQDQNRYNFALAIGFFDYVAKPENYLIKMRQLTTEKIIASFPKKWTFRTLIRWVRLSVAGCPVYFYDRKRLTKLFKDTGLDSYEIINLSRDYLVVIRMERNTN
ncbi:hypothetical protein A2W24_04015 [Microgenomates group bacterium RBG_16_45_19]|nr:MAG: hypothetical protein A2W24_04015 [Microgenomates group bacterium RBG_16_45_19]